MGATILRTKPRVSDSGAVFFTRAGWVLRYPERGAWLGVGPRVNWEIGHERGSYAGAAGT